jgi:hypothetical protein
MNKSRVNPSEKSNYSNASKNSSENSKKIKKRGCGCRKKKSAYRN